MMKCFVAQVYFPEKDPAYSTYIMYVRARNKKKASKFIRNDARYFGIRKIKRIKEIK